MPNGESKLFTLEQLADVISDAARMAWPLTVSGNLFAPRPGK
jgi:hypothetical protein